MRPDKRMLAPAAIATTVAAGVPAVISRLSPRRWSTRRRALPTTLGITCLALGARLVGESVYRVYITQHTPVGDRAPERLVVDGVYGFLRNPMSIGMFLVLMGESFTWNRRQIATWACVVAAVSAVASETVERRELEKAFGSEYSHYRARTAGWFPLTRLFRKREEPQHDTR